jgi:prepilin-type N-terminal cleavage/methylation domain-containing protein
MRFRKPGLRRPGFTLIEVLVVVAIISLLVAILLPALIKARLMGQQAGCSSNLRQIGQVMFCYAQTNAGSMPVGPIDQVFWYNVESPPSSPEISNTPRFNANWRAFLDNPWQWGGHRGLFQYLTDENNEPIPETRPRPLTQFMRKFPTLDSRTALFECPADQGLDYWMRVRAASPSAPDRTWGDLAFGKRPIHEMIGNSYAVCSWGPWQYTNETANTIKKWPDRVAMAMEAVMYFDGAYAINPPDFDNVSIHQAGWHGQDRRYNNLFLDMHGEFKYFRMVRANTFQADGGYKLINYAYLVDYFR